MAIKVTPYYRWATNQLYETVNLPSLGVSPSFNAGTLRVDGVEMRTHEGRFQQERHLRQSSRTRTRTRPRSGTTTSTARSAPSISTIKTSRSSTRSRRPGAARHATRTSADGKPDPKCGANSILNPYYNMPPAADARNAGMVRAGTRLPVPLAEHVRAGPELPAQQVGDHAGACSSPKARRTAPPPTSSGSIRAAAAPTRAASA